MADLFNAPAPVTNIPELSVSEISAALKRTVEDAFSYVRVRGEVSKVTLAKSGHLYTALKDDGAVLDAVAWKGTVARLSIRPEEGMEVIATGRLTTYPGRSNYQLIIESMELAGQGAILKLIEDRRRKLAAEGLFDPAMKKPLPFLPRHIGVVTSPTGAVIRDILHRIADRFPVHVTVWPVAVQGQNAAVEVVRGIEGFNNLPAPPDLIIVARGGGSFEDLMPFNEEAVVRAAAESVVPLISAVGHETDVTLIDFAADMRAPTPTAAAEMAVPVRAQLLAQVLDGQQRLVQGLAARIENARLQLDRHARPLANPARALEGPVQRLDRAALKADHAMDKIIADADRRLMRLAPRTPAEIVETMAQKLARAALHVESAFEKSMAGAERRLARIVLRTPAETLAAMGQKLGRVADRLAARPAHMLDPAVSHVAALGRMLETLSYTGVLKRGFAVVKDEKGGLVSRAAQLKPGQDVTIVLQDGDVAARVEKL